MSGFGINVSKLMRVAGWTMNRIEPGTDQDKVSMGTICGLVLLAEIFLYLVLVEQYGCYCLNLIS